MISIEIQKILHVEANFSEIDFLSDDLTFDWGRIDQLGPDSADVLESYNECLRLKRKLDPVLLQCERIFDHRRLFLDQLAELSQWTESSHDLMQSFDSLCDHESNSIVAVLKLSTAIEHGLCNLYKLLTSRSPPHLLKSLLVELSNHADVFTINQIFILQLVIGSSKGVNLRNLVWHGYLAIVPRCYAAFLFVVVISYGKLLINRPITFSRRPEILSPIPLDAISLNIEPILSSSLIRVTNFHLWLKLAELLTAGNYATAIVLLLPQIESILRLIYGEINEASVTAQVDSYYVIMDSIFYDYVLDGDVTPLVIGKINKAQQMKIQTENRRNKMLEVFPRTLMHLGFDLFHAADGPRIRDRISHGECVVTDESSREALGKLLPFITGIVEFYEKGKACEFNYESVFMNNMKFVRQYNEACDSVTESFRRLQVPEALGFESQQSQPATIKKINVEVKTFFRPFDEVQIVKLLLVVQENSTKALQSFTFSCSELFRLFNERKLSSARRQSLHHLVASSNNFHAAFTRILKVSRDSFVVVQSVDDDSINSRAIIKLLKLTLRFTESLMKHFSLDTRNFFAANKKTCEFLQLTDNCKCLRMSDVD